MEQDDQHDRTELDQAMEDMTKRFKDDFPDKVAGKATQDKSSFRWLKQRAPPIRFAVYLSPLVIFLVIPIALLSTVFHTTRVGPGDGNGPTVQAASLVIWIEIVVVALWVAMTLAWSWLWLFNRGCDVIKEKVKTHQLLLEALQDISRNLMHLPITLVLWTVISFATTPVICVFQDDKLLKDATGQIVPNQYQCSLSYGWIYTVNRVFEAGIVVSFLVWVERILIGMSFISYYGKQYDHKNNVLQWDIGQIKKLFYMTLHRRPAHNFFFSHSEAKVCHDCHSTRDNGPQTCLSFWGDQDWNDVFKSAIGHEDSAEALGVYLWYAIKYDLIDIEKFTWENQKQLEGNIKKPLLTEALHKWICREHETFPSQKKSWIIRREGEEPVQDIDDLDTKAFTDILNGDNDEDIEFDEMRTSVRRIGRRKQALTKTLKNVREAMESLDRPLSVLVLIAIAFVYCMWSC